MWTDENCDMIFETLTYQNRKNLIKAGFHMLQFSVYARTVRNNDDAKNIPKL